MPAASLAVCQPRQGLANPPAGNLADSRGGSSGWQVAGLEVGLRCGTAQAGRRQQQAGRPLEAPHAVQPACKGRRGLIGSALLTCMNHATDWELWRVGPRCRCANRHQQRMCWPMAQSYSLPMLSGRDNQSNSSSAPCKGHLWSASQLVLLIDEAPTTSLQTLGSAVARWRILPSPAGQLVKRLEGQMVPGQSLEYANARLVKTMPVHS